MGTQEKYHLENRADCREHFVVADLSVAIDVIYEERPVQFILFTASASDGKSKHEFIESDQSIVVLVDYTEDVGCVVGRVALGEIVFVYFLEVFYVQGPVFAALHEFWRGITVCLSANLQLFYGIFDKEDFLHTFIPMLQFPFVKAGVFL